MRATSMADEFVGETEPTTNGASGDAKPEEPDLGEWDAGDDIKPPPPRGWLLGNVFCRRFISSLISEGGVGKTALRYAQLLSLATGRPLTGEHVFQRCRVLIVSLEDDADELRRRILAARKHYGIPLDEVKGWLFLAAPGLTAGKLAIERDRRVEPSALAETLDATIRRRQIDIVSLDPFVKAHAVDENSNNAIDTVVQILAGLAVRHDLAVDIPHHASKGMADPGNANRGRGASAMKDGGRLVYTLTPMSTQEAETFGLSEEERRLLIRMDSAKVNITRPTTHTIWFRLAGVHLGNASELYPNGDEVQTVERWTPPDTWDSLSVGTLNLILDDIASGLDDGDRYSAAGAAKSRAAWRVVLKHAENKTEHQAREIIRTWVKGGVIFTDEYPSRVERKNLKGLFVEPTKRPR